MKYLNFILTVISVLLILLLVKICFLPEQDHDFEHIGEGDQILDKKTGIIYDLNIEKRVIAELNLRSGEAKRINIKTP